MFTLIVILPLSLFRLATTIESNLTIPTLTNWKYLDEGYPTAITEPIANCYGFGDNIIAHKIGNTDIDYVGTYTLIPYPLGFMTVRKDGVRTDHEYKLYSKQRWFITDYLIICK